METPKIRVITEGLGGTIYAGKPNKKNTGFVDAPVDVTSDVYKAIIDHVQPGMVRTIMIGDVPVFEIEVRAIIGQGAVSKDESESI